MSTSRLRLPAIVFATLVMSLSFRVAQADGEQSASAAMQKEFVTVYAQLSQAAAAKNRHESTVADYVPPKYSYAKVPACSGNDIDVGIDVPCEEAATACGVPGQYQYWLYRGPTA